MRVNHGSAYILMSEQLLDGADIVAVLEQVRRERMAQGVGARARRSGTS